MISEKQYADSAKLLGAEVAALKAVAEVESGGDGMLLTGEPKILFEPHIFWKELRKAGIDPATIQGAGDILYPTWGTKPYGKVSQQHERMGRAAAINREAALKAASWGKFQILGSNYKLAGFDNVQDFVNAMYKGEDEQLEAFVNFIKNTFLDDELRAKDWKGFARGYNGALYTKNNYDKKLAAAYAKYWNSL
jgi:hypothetical protein